MGAGQSTMSQARPGIVVTLDALSTLYTFREPITTQYIKVAGRCGLKAPIKEDDLTKAFRKSYKEISSEYPNYGKDSLKSPRAWWKTVVNDSFRQVVDEKEIPDHLAEELYDHFTSSAAYRLYSDVKPFFASIRELKQRLSNENDPPILVGVVSNSDPRVKSVLQSLGLRVGIDAKPTLESMKERATRTGPDMGEIMKSPWHHAYNYLNDVDFLATSYTAGAEKPDPEIFRFASTLATVNYASKLEQARDDWTPGFQSIKAKLQISKRMLAIHQSKFVHIGDDYAKDYCGAEASGWEALHLIRDGDDQSPYDGANTITDLEQAAIAIRILVDQLINESTT